MKREITLKHFIIDLDTPLNKIPRAWLQYIEPKVMRGGFLPCWVWTGKVHVHTGRGLFNYRGKQVQAHRFVAQIFWDFPPEYWVKLTCTTLNCVNPAHLVIEPVDRKNINTDPV